MTRHRLSALLLLCATTCFARDAVPVKACTTADAPPETRALEERGLHLAVEKCFAYADKTGDYALYLSGTSDRRYPDETLSTAVAAQLFRKAPDGSMALQWVIRDHAGKDEAGVSFSPHLMEFPDLAGDGVVTPMVVYQFAVFKEGTSDVVDDDSFSGRIKLIWFHGTTKIAIRAITGDLDGDRATRATDSFYALPKKERAYLAHKLEKMYMDQDFGFDNSYEFYPQKEKGQ